MSTGEAGKKSADSGPSASNSDGKSSSPTMERKSSPASGEGEKKSGMRFPFLEKFRKSKKEKRSELGRRRSSAGTDEEEPRQGKNRGGHLVDHEPHSAPMF